MVVSAEDQVLAGIEHGRLGQALAGLSPELRGAIEATVLDGLTCAEAAVLLGVAEGTVKSRCHRARVALRAALAGQQAGSDGAAYRPRGLGDIMTSSSPGAAGPWPERTGILARTSWPVMPPGRPGPSLPGRWRRT